MLKWFCIDGGHILDPFGGEQTKGVVAGELGYKYTGVEIRQEQVDLNREKTKRYKNVQYICGDSTKISQYVGDEIFDMVFTSPPYYDLEIYSNGDMSSVGTYEEFMTMYKQVFAQCYEKLAEDSFLVIKIGEIRDRKTGIYRNFVGDNIQLFKDMGLLYYNEIILATAIGTAAVRASLSMSTRKVCKVHQNVLVFFKGNPAHIKEKFGVIDIDSTEESNEI